MPSLSHTVDEDSLQNTTTSKTFMSVAGHTITETRLHYIQPNERAFTQLDRFELSGCNK